MPDRFYFDGPLTPELELDPTESHHLSRVLRKQAGDHVEVFNGQGDWATATVEHVSKKAVLLRLDEIHSDPLPAKQLTLAVASPKGDRFRWLVEMATELGVQRLIPLSTERSVVSPGHVKLDKLRQTVIAACKQCGRNHLLEITPVHTLQELLQQADSNFIYGDMGAGSPLPATWHSLTAIIGPEGGLTDEEVDQIKSAGGQPMSVSPHILRVETAGIALAAVVLTASSIE